MADEQDQVPDMYEYISNILDNPLGVDDGQLLAAFEYSLAEAQHWQIASGHLEQDIHRRLEERGAKAIPSNHYICELSMRNMYDQAAFTPLKELLVQADLDVVLRPAHTETVAIPDEWYTQKILALGRRLPEVQHVVDSARRELRGKLKFERRKEAK